MSEQRTWQYGLTADEWLHLASEGEESEVTPCCGNLGHIRELLMLLTTCQSQESQGTRRFIADELRTALEADGEGHGLHDPKAFPLLHQVLDGLRAESHDTQPD